ncbi:acyl-CoA thioesterase [Ktedonospora formicarum]|uniref:Acyl-CoA thioesterase n=1 Tax=Ktedonospora formicarum TaxID=2778364 RepID=A0A8J3I5J1_9CHLR|nr:thioesterase family protein [Ktedonospora formicarum]GHO46293.1 acyl-CoA thioesterase [Ktedonospora formicarum]
MPRASVQIRVPFPDVDSSGRIHFTAMLRYMEVVEHELMRSIGFPYVKPLPGVVFPRVHVSCDFRGAIRYDDLLRVEARVARVGGSSWSLTFTARAWQDDNEGAPLAEGEMTIVAMDPETERARPLPSDLRDALASE